MRKPLLSGLRDGREERRPPEGPGKGPSHTRLFPETQETLPSQERAAGLREGLHLKENLSRTPGRSRGEKERGPGAECPPTCHCHIALLMRTDRQGQLMWEGELREPLRLQVDTRLNPSRNRTDSSPCSKELEAELSRLMAPMRPGSWAVRLQAP